MRSLRAVIFALSILIRSRDVYAIHIVQFFIIGICTQFSFVDDPLQPKLFRSKVVEAQKQYNKYNQNSTKAPSNQEMFDKMLFQMLVIAISFKDSRGKFAIHGTIII